MFLNKIFLIFPEKKNRSQKVWVVFVISFRNMFKTFCLFNKYIQEALHTNFKINMKTYSSQQLEEFVLDNYLNPMNFLSNSLHIVWLTSNMLFKYSH